MSAQAWSGPVPADVAHRRAGGRRRHNAERRRARDARRARVAALVLAKERPCAIEAGWAPRVARMLGVHPSTISRDLATVRPTLALPERCCRWHVEAMVREGIRQRAEAAMWAKLARFGIRPDAP